MGGSPSEGNQNKTNIDHAPCAISNFMAAIARAVLRESSTRNEFRARNSIKRCGLLLTRVETLGTCLGTVVNGVASI